MRLPDPARSRAVLIGTSSYTDPNLPDLPVVRDTVADLAATLTDPAYGVLAAEHCLSLVDEGDLRLLGRKLRAALDEAEDLLVVYFTGHGLVSGRRHDLYLALPDSDWTDPGFNALEYDKLRSAVLDSPAAIKIVILDCCFSGRAVSDTMADGMAGLVNQLEVAGTYVLTSAQRDQVALALDGEPHHVGTEHILLGLIREGEGIPAKALESLEISLAAVRRRVKVIVGQGQKAPSGHIPFTSGAKNVLELSNRVSIQFNHNYISTEHILLGLIEQDEGVAIQVLVALGTDLPLLRQRVTYLLAGPAPRAKAVSMPPGPLDQYGRNLTRAARAGELDPVIGREKEIERVVQVLSRRTKNNPVLIGEQGVGKTAVIHGLAQAMVNGEIIRSIGEKSLYSLELGALEDGAHNRSGIVERMRGVLSEISTRWDVLLFVDQLHTVFGPHATGTGTVIATSLKPLLAQGRIQMIGACRSDASDRFLNREAEAEYRFQPVPVAEPSVAQTIEMLKAQRARIEAYHRVSITDGALAAAANLADRYISDRFQPDKAIDLIDESGSRMRIRRMSPPPGSREIDEKIAVIRRDKESAVDAQDFGRASALRDQQKLLTATKAEREEEWKNTITEVDVEVVAEVLVSIYGIHVDAAGAAPTPPAAPADPPPTLTDEDREIWAMS